MGLEFLIKFTKNEWAEEISSLGKLYFNPAYKFFTSQHYSPGQYDQWDSHINNDAMHLVWAPIIEEKANGIKYGPGTKLADKARVHFLDNRNRNIPICCFRMIFDNDIKEDIFKFDDQLYDRVRRDFPEYDSFVLILPHAFFDILSRSNFIAYGHSVYYGDTIEFDDFYQGNGEKGFEDKYPYLQMFNKETQHKYQQEFRMILPTQQWDNGNSIEIGSLKDISMVGKISQLNVGYHIQKSMNNEMCYYEINEMT